MDDDWYECFCCSWSGPLEDLCPEWHRRYGGFVYKCPECRSIVTSAFSDLEDYVVDDRLGKS